jgi:ABC-type transport system involved in Fe-S cluster assembly fused permease/ATPase subunit
MSLINLFRYNSKVYLHNLNDDDKTQLDKYGISNELISSNVLFDYLSFIQHLDTHILRDSIEKWIATVKISNYSTQINYKILIYRLLFRIFIENEVNITYI